MMAERDLLALSESRGGRLRTIHASVALYGPEPRMSSRDTWHFGTAEQVPFSGETFTLDE